MEEALVTYGRLTDNQMAAIERCIAKDNARRAERAAERTQAAPAVEISKVETALRTAQANGLQWPKLRLGSFAFSLAGEASKNAGATYVKRGETYLGKVQDGRFFCSRDCDEPTKAAIVAAVNDPEAAAIAYGKATGSCSCCGRTLTNQESIDLGIGPICREKFGWA